MIGVLSHSSALEGYTGPRTTWANKMMAVMNYANGAGLLNLLTINPACYQGLGFNSHYKIWYLELIFN